MRRSVLSLLIFPAFAASCAPVDVSGLLDRNDAATAADTSTAPEDASAVADAATPIDAATTDRSAAPIDTTVPPDRASDVPSSADAPAATDVPSTPADVPSAVVDAPVATTDAPSTAADVPAIDRPSPVDAPAPSDVPPPVDRPVTPDVPTPVDAGETQPTLPPPPPFGYAPLTIIERRLNGTGVLVDDRRTLFAYDAMRRLETTESQTAEAGGTWRPLTRTTYRYDASGRLSSADGTIRSGALWLDSERIRYDYDAAGQRTVDHHDVLTFPGGWVENWRYVWEWNAGRPTWRRFWQVPSSGGDLYYSNYHAFSYEADGRLRGLGRGDRSSATGTWSDAGGFTYVAWPNGALRAYDFRRNSRTSHADYLYAASGLLRDVSFTALNHTAYLYDARGRLQLIRTYVPDEAGGARVSDEVELTHTDAGSSYTFALDPYPYATWMMGYYGRGDVLDRYRR